MRFSGVIISAFLVFGICALLIGSAVKMRPGIGIIAATLLMALMMWVRGEGFGNIGLQPPANWLSAILQAFVYAILISVVSMAFIEPFAEALTHTVHDYGPVGKIKGDWVALLQILLFVWLFVAVSEEFIFRGFLMAEFEKIAGAGFFSTIVGVLFTSIVFGLCHAYQNSSGIITTSIIGALLAVVFLVSGRNLWVPIFTHGFIDTVGILSIYFGADKYLRQLVWGGG